MKEYKLTLYGHVQRQHISAIYSSLRPVAKQLQNAKTTAEGKNILGEHQINQS